MAAIVPNLVTFGRTLRRLGLPVTTGQIAALAEALGWVELGARDQVYHTARSLLVKRREDLELFQIVFNHFWSRTSGTGGKRSRGIAERRRDAPFQQRFSIATYRASVAKKTDPSVDLVDRHGTYSEEEILQGKDFSEMSADELEEVRRLMMQIQWRIALRRSRRRVADRRGNIVDLRRTLRETARLRSVPLHLPRRRPKVKERPLILIADISGSMEKYSRLVLQFFYVMSRSLREVECFVFGTRLSRITPEMRIRNVDRAIDAAAREVVDWAGGTRIGACLRTFNRDWSRRVLRRGAVVLVISDGWDRGDVEVLRHEMRYLQARCHHLGWLNPHQGRPGYRPVVSGMAAALDYVDDFRSVRNLEALRDLAGSLADLPHRARSKRS